MAPILAVAETCDCTDLPLRLGGKWRSGHGLVSRGDHLSVDCVPTRHPRSGPTGDSPRRIRTRASVLPSASGVIVPLFAAKALGSSKTSPVSIPALVVNTLSVVRSSRYFSFQLAGAPRMPKTSRHRRSDQMASRPTEAGRARRY